MRLRLVTSPAQAQSARRRVEVAPLFRATEVARHLGMALLLPPRTRPEPPSPPDTRAAAAAAARARLLMNDERKLIMNSFL